jgi:hypothetical protein
MATTQTLTFRNTKNVSVDGCYGGRVLDGEHKGKSLFISNAWIKRQMVHRGAIVEVTGTFEVKESYSGASYLKTVGRNSGRIIKCEFTETQARYKAERKAREEAYMAEWEKRAVVRCDCGWEQRVGWEGRPVAEGRRQRALAHHQKECPNQKKEVELLYDF